MQLRYLAVHVPPGIAHYCHCHNGHLGFKGILNNRRAYASPESICCHTLPPPATNQNRAYSYLFHNNFSSRHLAKSGKSSLVYSLSPTSGIIVAVFTK